MNKKDIKKIAMIEEALKKDTKEKAKANRNFNSIIKLQKEESNLNKRLGKVQDLILKKLELRFDYSDDVTTSSVKSILKNLKKGIKYVKNKRNN